MWLSRKLSSIIKQKSYTIPFKKVKEQHVSFVLAVISGVHSTGKTTLIQRLGLQELQYHRQLYRLKNNEQFIIQVIEYNGIPPNLELLDGVFICYDTTNSNSMDYLPDLIHVFVSQHVPCVLIGLKSDLTVQRKVDSELGHLIGNLFGVQVVEANNVTHQGIQLLQKCFIQFIYSDRKILLQNQQQIDHSMVSLFNQSPVISRSSSCSTTQGGESISSIVDQMLAHHPDEQIVTIFLTVFRKFMKPIELVNILIQRFELDQKNDMHMIPTIRQERVKTFFYLWLSQYRGDFTSSVTRRVLVSFLEKVSLIDKKIYELLVPFIISEVDFIDRDTWGLVDEEPKNEETIIKKKPKVRLLSLRRAASTHSRSFRSILSITTTKSEMNYCTAKFSGGLISIEYRKLSDSYLMLTEYSPLEFAQQLTWIEMNLFGRIQPRDFLRHLWNKQHKNPVQASIEHFNFISGWITGLIVNQVLFEKRVVLFEICLQIATELRRLNNFNTLMAVLAGINSAAVLRLKRTREFMKSKNPNLYEEFLSLETLMSSERSFSNYRSTLKQTELPGIPYLGIHQQDLVSLGEANKDHKMDGKVHWNKFRLMGESILEMMRFQHPTYLLESNPFLLYFIGHQSISSEDELYEKSKEIEPRHNMSSLSTSSSTSSRWLTTLK